MLLSYYKVRMYKFGSNGNFAKLISHFAVECKTHPYTQCLGGYSGNSLHKSTATVHRYSFPNASFPMW